MTVFTSAKKGEKAAKPAIAVVIGRNVKTVSRMLQKAEEKAQVTEGEDFVSAERALIQLENAITKLERTVRRLESPGELEHLTKSLTSKRMSTLIREGRKETSRERLLDTFNLITQRCRTSPWPRPCPLPAGE